MPRAPSSRTSKLVASALRTYRGKRRFERTAEPAGSTERGPATRGSAPLSFVVQRHAARSLHYDLRLELDGVLKSWAVPKGPSNEPGVRRLAVEVEDHPLEYGSFEGTIPAGEYGAGTVIIWDRGMWIPEGDPRRGLREGKISFELRGGRLRGHWSLVRMSGREGPRKANQWLLIKAARRTATAGRATSRAATPAARSSTVKGARTRRSRASTRGVLPDLEAIPGARAGAQPGFFVPQLASLGNRIPTGDDWLHEVKFDGYRLLCFLRGGRAELRTRGGRDWTHRFPAIAQAVEALEVPQAVLDGEVVVLGEGGRSDFQALQRALRVRSAENLRLALFDLPHCAGVDLTGASLIDRKEALREVLERAGVAGGESRLLYSEHVLGQGDRLFTEACRMGLEGLISKQAASPYVSGRTRAWMKTKCSRRQEFVIIGFTDPAGGREGLGALLLGAHEAGQLVYSGRVGTGFDDATLRRLRIRLDTLARKSSPLARPPPVAETRGVHWVTPHLVAEVRFSEWTREGRLRHPAFEGLREDKAATDVVREAEGSIDESGMDASPTRRSSRTGASRTGPSRTGPSRTGASRTGARRASLASAPAVRMTNPERVLYPEEGITKEMLAEYYGRVADRLLPHVVDRPLTLLRCPRGYRETCFYQKHGKEGAPPHVRSVTIREKSGTGDYLVIDDLAGLLSLVQLGTLELHPWGSRAADLERPDRLVFDLDPGPGVQWRRVIEAAGQIRAALDGVKLTGFVQTSGGKGLHVVVPLAPRASWDEAKSFARAVARSLEAHAPDRYVATASKAKRNGRIFVDYLRNDRGATSVAPYSTRARRGAPIAMPLRWSELPAIRDAGQFTLLDAAQRLSRRRRDPWDGYFDLRQSLPRAGTGAD